MTPSIQHLHAPLRLRRQLARRERVQECFEKVRAQAMATLEQLDTAEKAELYAGGIPDRMVKELLPEFYGALEDPDQARHFRGRTEKLVAELLVLLAVEG